METVTLYNHKPIGSDLKPLIPNLIFKETVESLERGEVDFYELILEEYSLESYQKNLAASMYRKIINKANEQR